MSIMEVRMSHSVRHLLLLAFVVFGIMASLSGCDHEPISLLHNPIKMYTFGTEKGSESPCIHDAVRGFKV
jgi:hypothetical protein